MEHPDTSTFFQLCQSSFFNDSLFKPATTAQKVICVPFDSHVLAFSKTVNNLKSRLQIFCKAHFLQQLKQSYFINDNGQVLFLQSNSKTLQTYKGFKSKFDIQILQEFTFYNSQNNPYKVWVLDRCILNEWKEIKEKAQEFETKITNEETKQNLQFLEPTNSFECEKLLQDYAPEIYSAVQAFVQTFNRSFVLLDNVHETIIQKFSLFQDQLTEDFASDFANPKIVNTLKTSINTVLVSGCFEKLMKYWIKSFQQQDLQCKKSIDKIFYAPLDILGIDQLELIKVDYHDAVQHLMSLTTVSSPFEKGRVLKKTLDLIVECINNFQKSQQQQLQKSNAVTSDEMIPLLSFVIIKASISNFVSHVRFASDFQTKELSLTEYGYALVTTEAAIEFINREAQKYKFSDTYSRFSNELQDEKSPIKRRAMDLREDFSESEERKSLSPAQHVRSVSSNVSTSNNNVFSVFEQRRISKMNSSSQLKRSKTPNETKGISIQNEVSKNTTAVAATRDDWDYKRQTLPSSFNLSLQKEYDTTGLNSFIDDDE